MVVANWKSNKTQQETTIWLEQIKSTILQSEKTVVICPSFTLLSVFSQQIPVKHIGAQDISPFGMGAYTGEVNGVQIKEFAQYVIIGHSERRQYFNENDEMITKKVMVAKQAGLIPILCVQGKDTPVPEGIEIVAYEPIWAIGSGKAESPQDADNIAKAILEKTGAKIVLYGGSVTEENVASFTHMEHIGGVLVGGASLDPQKFSLIISHA